MSKPGTPSPEEVEKYLKQWSTLENYKLQEKSLSMLFNDFCPCNEKTEDILLKVSALNDFYSTNIYDTYSVAKHILKCNIDDGLNSGDISIVNKITPVVVGGKVRRFYSFATKYCSHHKPDKYPIYDSYVEKMLMHFKKTDNYHVFKKNDLKNYPKFIEVIKAFREHFQLEKYSLREVDIYLWLAGKEYFPNKY